MKKNTLLIASSVMALVALAAASNYVLAAETNNNSDTNGKFGKMHGMRPDFKNLSVEERTALATKMTERRAEMVARKAAIDKALEAGDYNAWLSAVGTANPLVSKITADNFPQYVEIYKLRQQILEKNKALGLDGIGGGFGFRHGPQF